MAERWLDWSRSLLTIAQEGLTYGQDPFDRTTERQIRRMFELACGEGLRDRGEPVGVAGIIEDTSAGPVDQDLVRVHPRPRGIDQWLGHERGLHAALAGQLLDRRFERRKRIGGYEGRQKRQVELELATRHLVVTGLDPDPERFQGGHDLQLDLARAPPASLEVAARIVGQRPDSVARGEEEELDLRGDEISEPRRFGLVEE